MTAVTPGCDAPVPATRPKLYSKIRSKGKSFCGRKPLPFINLVVCMRARLLVVPNKAQKKVQAFSACTSGTSSNGLLIAAKGKSYIAVEAQGFSPAKSHGSKSGFRGC